MCGKDGIKKYVEYSLYLYMQRNYFERCKTNISDYF